MRYRGHGVWVLIPGYIDTVFPVPSIIADAKFHRNPARDYLWPVRDRVMNGAL